MANIKDVAKYAGVGLGTVSRFLNGYNVTEENREKIQRAIKDLNYSVNPIARSMKTKKSMTVAVIVPRLANIFSMKIIESIENYLDDFGYSTIICDCADSSDIEIKKLKYVMEKMVDGIVLMSSNKSSGRIKKIVGDTPVVLVDRVFNNNIFDSITVDNENSTYRIINEFIKNNHKRIGVIAGPEHISTSEERLSGVKKAFDDNKAILSDDLIYKCEFNIEDGYDAAKKLLEKGPDTLFASNYELTIGAIKALNENKLVIGKDINLIGFDNLELINVYPYSMTVISQPVNEIGTQAAKCLQERMENKQVSIKNVVLLNEIIRT